MFPKQEYPSALVFFGSFVFGYVTQLTDWIRSPGEAARLQTGPAARAMAMPYGHLVRSAGRCARDRERYPEPWIRTVLRCRLKQGQVDALRSSHLRGVHEGHGLSCRAVQRSQNSMVAG